MGFYFSVATRLCARPRTSRFRHNLDSLARLREPGNYETNPNPIRLIRPEYKSFAAISRLPHEPQSVLFSARNCRPRPGFSPVRPIPDAGRGGSSTTPPEQPNPAEARIFEHCCETNPIDGVNKSFAINDFSSASRSPSEPNSAPVSSQNRPIRVRMRPASARKPAPSRARPRRWSVESAG